jgi:hypothetical protein
VKIVEKYQAEDGTLFDSKNACREYENSEMPFEIFNKVVGDHDNTPLLDTAKWRKIYDAILENYTLTRRP